MQLHIARPKRLADPLNYVQILEIEQKYPNFRMKSRRVVENRFYINEIPIGSLGDVSADPHMREIPYPEAEQITFFIYEEIASCKRQQKNWD